MPVRVEEAKERTQRGPTGPPLPALNMSGVGFLSQHDFTEQLKAAIYGKPPRGHHPTGTLSPRAMRLLADNPDRLLAFDRVRELFGLVTGDELLLLTPVSLPTSSR